jgi:hypothetical protein
VTAEASFDGVIKLVNYLFCYSGEPGYEVSESALVTRAASVDESLKDHALVVGKAASIGCKVRRRMYARIANRLTNLQLRTKETVERLNFTVDLVSVAGGLPVQ